MTSVQTSSTHNFARPTRPYAASPASLRKNSVKSVAATPVLSSFAIDLIAQFDNYRVNMRESLQREVEENIHKAKVLKEAMKESSDMDAEMLISEEQDEYDRSINKGRSTPNNRSNTSLNRLQQQQQQLSQQPPHSQQHPSQQQQQPYPSGKQNPSTTSINGGEKRSRLDRIFGRRTSTINSTNTSLRNHQVTPHPQPSPSQQPQQFATAQSNTLAAPTNGQHLTSNSNSSAVDLNNYSYLQVEEGGTDEDEEVVLDRSMGAGVGSATSGAAVAEPIGTEVKLHPTRAKTFALPKSLRNLKRRIAALRAKGTDLDAERREKEERERAANGGVALQEKKKFTLIRLLPWKTSKKPAGTA
ncbi:hypothetical protein BG015_008329 [Linnemannia schmuckeri]|uniref:Uncharacterized protein n=1 Tax=Linnemannia schmuckeri TaxID=64567 RepID=A0A9P5S0M8_9FUNG|nr:hypothetical protein BG015_008329 [Linnemannia schmuckeri]